METESGMTVSGAKGAGLGVYTCPYECPRMRGCGRIASDLPAIECMEGGRVLECRLCANREFGPGDGGSAGVCVIDSWRERKLLWTGVCCGVGSSVCIGGRTGVRVVRRSGTGGCTRTGSTAAEGA